MPWKALLLVLAESAKHPQIDCKFRLLLQENILGEDRCPGALFHRCVLLFFPLLFLAH